MEVREAREVGGNNRNDDEEDTESEATDDNEVQHQDGDDNNRRVEVVDSYNNDNINEDTEGDDDTQHHVAGDGISGQPQPVDETPFPNISFPSHAVSHLPIPESDPTALHLTSTSSASTIATTRQDVRFVSNSNLPISNRMSVQSVVNTTLTPQYPTIGKLPHSTYGCSKFMKI
jgi:hypothetical protein